MSIGSELRQAREDRGVSLRDLSERTKIRQAVLRAIEGDDYERLPGGVISRGFLKLYAREVGLDPDEIGRRYTERVAETGTGDSRQTSDLEGSDHRPSPRARDKVPRASVAGALVVVVLLVAGYFALRPSQASLGDDESDSRVETAEVTTAEPAAAAATPEPPPSGGKPATSGPTADATGGRAPAAPNQASAGDGLRVELHATGACWLAATSDGQQVAYRVINAGERLAFRVSSEAVLRIGAPGNLDVSINDRPIRPFDRPGTPVTLRITPDNFRELIAQ